ncbi:hypothetical protein D6C93_09575 [Aureobasidium pullulans]|nr:hypothetical protein D6C93_09575 [Aureobasidium pullulans]
MGPLGPGPDAVTHNRIVVFEMLQTPEAYSPSRWQDAADMIDEHLSKGARLDGTYLRAEDVELKEDIAAALRSVTSHQTQGPYLEVTQIMRARTSIAGGPFLTPMTSMTSVKTMIKRAEDRQNYLDSIPNRYLGTVTYDRAMIPNCGDYRDPVLSSAKTMAGMEIASRGKSLNELMYFDAAEECFERSPDEEKESSPKLPPPAKKFEKETEDNKLLEKCPINHKSIINPATKHNIRLLIDAPAIPIPEIGIQSATKADVWRWIHLVGLTVNAPTLSTEMFIAIRFHLFMLWAKRWDMVPWKHLTEERTKLQALITMPKEASIHECLYMSVKQLEDSDPQHGARITNPDWTFGDAVIFLPIHPLPHLLRRDRKSSAVELWKAMDYPTADTAGPTGNEGVLAQGRRAAIKKMCDLFLTDWTPYINGTNDPAASEFGRGSDNSSGGFWRFTDHMEKRPLAMGEFEKKCIIGYLPALDGDLRPAHSQQRREKIEDQNYENQSPTSADGEHQGMAAASDYSMSGYINAAETLPYRTMLSGDEQAFFMSTLTEDDEAGHIQPGGQRISNDQEMAELENESGMTTEVSSASVTEFVGVEDRDPPPSLLSDTSEDDDDDRNPGGQSDELEDHDVPTTGSTPHMQSVEDMTISTNSGEPSSEVGDIHDQPVKQENDDQGTEWTQFIPYGRWDGFGDDEVLGWI